MEVTAFIQDHGDFFFLVRQKASGKHILIDNNQHQSSNSKPIFSVTDLSLSFPMQLNQSAHLYTLSSIVDDKNQKKTMYILHLSVKYQ